MANPIVTAVYKAISCTLLANSFMLIKGRNIYLKLNRKPMYRNTSSCIEIFLFSLFPSPPWERFFFRHEPLRNIARMLTRRACSSFSSNFAARTRTDGFLSRIFFSLLFLFFFFGSRVRGVSARRRTYLADVGRKGILGAENEVGSLAVKSRESADN